MQVRVSEFQFNQAVEALSTVYESNYGCIKTNEFRAFKDDANIPPLGIQLTVIGSEFDFFWKFRDVLLQNELFKIEYDNLKREFEGKDMEAYREAKNDFFSKIIQTPEFRQLKTNVDRNV
ncbi:GrpB family protein [Lysinibacillus sp. NPDC093688]|uniref:GrpB family protein n=1 Tax=Lysinibacillus sp. NPDC093688 TaxID=3390577 RepID=UPI003D04D4EA